MRRLSALLATGVIVLAALSCGGDKSSNPGGNNNPLDSYLSCKINGTVWSGPAMVETYSGKTGTTYTAVYAFKAAASDTSWVSINFSGTSTGSFDLSQGMATGDIIYSPHNTDMNVFVCPGTPPAVGQINVTTYGAVGAYVDGTFSGKCDNFEDSTSVTITEGTFHAKRLP
jgi:hypothetical protein